MATEERDHEVFRGVARRLFWQGRELFRRAHARGMDSFHAPTLDEHLRELDEALEQERRAIAMQEVAIRLQASSAERHARRLAELKAAARDLTRGTGRR